MKTQFLIFSAMTLVGFSSLTSCRSASKFKEGQKLGGVEVSSDTLNSGYVVYTTNCMQCHGMNGDGKGPASRGMAIPPRDFTAGSFKFSHVALGELPRDEDLKDTISKGLHGTPMLPWDMSEQELHAVVQYIKTFSPVWKEQNAGTALEVSEDPFGTAKASEAVELGRKVFHLVGNCQSCHPSYAQFADQKTWAKEMKLQAPSEPRENPLVSMPMPSSYGETLVVPPDFTQHEVKSYRGDIKSLYQRLASGVNGTSMPAWKGTLSPKNDALEAEKNLWAVAYYVDSLMALKKDPEARKKFIAELKAGRGN